MMARKRSRDADIFELNQRRANSDTDLPLYNTELDDSNAQSHLLGHEQPAYPHAKSVVERLSQCFSLTSSRWRRSARRKHKSRIYPAHSHQICTIVTSLAFAVVLVVAIFFPSYTNPPKRYTELRKSVERSDVPGAGNAQNQKIFIAASIFDKGGDLAGGKWAECVLRLVHILGPTNVYLSIYENDAGEEAETALKQLEKQVTCEHTLKFDQHLSYNEVDNITLPDGSVRVKRVTYLSEARNRALLPLNSASVTYDKLLYINDVVFDPVEAAQLLFLTGSGNDSAQTADYRAACAVDFINPIKYYDTFATRDYEGYGIGLPLFPWYTTAGQGISRREVLASSDAVPVRSCWGGMVAFDARFFQQQSTATPQTAASQSSAKMVAPYKFRAEPDVFWEASECCLIHADIQDPDSRHSGIFMNPFVRTAYDWNTLQWLGLVRRFERLLTPVHWTLTKIVGMPWYNARRAEQPGAEVDEEVWVSDPNGGSFKLVKRIATHSGFCGRRGLQLMKQDRSQSGRPWEEYPVP